MKVVFQLGLWSMWLSGFILIAISIYATQKLPSFNKEQIQNHKLNYKAPKIAIFTAPAPFTGSVGSSQSLAILSWLGLSPAITVVLFSQHPSVAAFAANFSSRLLVEPNIDFTFLGTPFLHSMIARAQTFKSDISVLIDTKTILLPDFISTLNYAYEIEHDWLLVASSRNVSYFPFELSDAGKFWLRKDGKRVTTQEFQEILDQSLRWNLCEGRMLMAWNSVELPLHNGVLPPFLYGKGIHNPWVISEALLCEFRVVFDASWTISSLSLNDPEHLANQTGEESQVAGADEISWESVGNSHLGAVYGSSFFHKVDYSGLANLVKCDGQYLFVNITENIVFPVTFERPSSWNGQILRSWRLKKLTACLDGLKLLHRRCSLTEQLNPLPLIDFPFSLELLLSVIADENKTIVLAVAGHSYRDMLMSWVCRLRRLRVTNFVVCALDYETYEFSILQGLPVFNDPSAPSNISFDDCHFGTKCFQRVTKVKSRMVLHILKLGYNVLLSDVDVYWFKNPLTLLYTFGPSVLAAQSDEYKVTGAINLPRRLNSGFYFARSDRSTIAAMEKVVKHAASSGLSEQPSFYDTLCGPGGSNRVGEDRCVEPETNLTVHFLDRNLFPNGAYLGLWQKKNVRKACAKKGCLVLHNNWISGRLKKLERQVLSGLWDYDSGTRMCKQRWQGLVSEKDRDAIKRKEFRRAPMPLDMTIQSRDIYVRIVHAGGQVDQYRNAVSASRLMEKYPGMYVARPEVFKNPHESFLLPEDMLLPGRKYYMIPSTTAQKLKRDHLKIDISEARITWEVHGDNLGESIRSAKDFYVSGESCSAGRKKRGVKHRFVPPLPRTMFQGYRWEPSLTPIQELSP